MATTKRSTGTSRGRGSSNSRGGSSGSRSGGNNRGTAQRLLDELPDTDEITRAARSRPKTTAAIAAGLVTGIAAGVAGYMAWKRSGKSWEEFSNDVATSVKDSASNARTRIKDGIEDARTRAQTIVDRRKDGLDDDSMSTEDTTQAMFAEEALTLKETGRKPKRPVDETISMQPKAGAAS